jgi:murein DD-endopeptidase MepM/ murein hydrolase activator NlpD
MTASAAVPPVALAPAALATVEVGPAPNVELMSALAKGLAEARKPPAPPAPGAAPGAGAAGAGDPAPAAAALAPARASRDRSPAVVPPVAPAPQFARPSDGALTSVYGRRWGRLHAGIDLAAGSGSAIRSVAAGAVSAAGTESGYGRTVRIVHPDGTMTVYAHMSELLVSTGQQVEAGTQIGREGSTGRSTGPHLHFEVRVDGTPVDPLAWLRARGIGI